MLIIINDIFAYLFGYFFGKHQLIALSPKKTWEGYIGGAISTCLFSIIVTINILSWLKLSKAWLVLFVPVQLFTSHPSSFPAAKTTLWLSWKLVLSQLLVFRVIVWYFPCLLVRLVLLEDSSLQDLKDLWKSKYIWLYIGLRQLYSWTWRSEW